MTTELIYIKTALGIEEIQNRKLHLPPRLRTMLIMIDGRKTVSALKEDATKFGCPENFLEALEAAALITISGAANAPAAAAAVASDLLKQPAAPTEPHLAQDEYGKFRVAKDFMNNAVVNSLGIKGFFFTLKLERAGSVTDLRELVKPFQAAITKASGEAEAEVLTKQLLAYLS